MAVVRWTFQDLTLPTPNTYEFDVNPSEGGTPKYRKSVQYQNTAAPDGQTIVFEGRDEPQALSITGVILEEEHHDAMVEWFEKRHQILITDDLGRSFMVYITALDLTRQRAVQHPWKHRYTMEYIVLDWDL